jgi:hypothetical protein
VGKAEPPTVLRGAERTFYVKAGRNYDFDLRTLLPDLAGLDENVIYNPRITENGDGVLDALSYSSGDTLSLPVHAGAADGKTARVAVTISSRNYANFDAYILVKVLSKEVATITGLSTLSAIYDGDPKDGYAGVPVFSGGTPVDTALSAYYTGVLSNGTPYIDHTTTPTAAGGYTLRLTLENDVLYYAEWTGRFVIEKADPADPGVQSASAVYGQSLAALSPPSGFSWKSPDSSVGNVGTNRFDALYTPDPNNYNAVAAVVDVTVAPKSLTVADITAASRAYDGTTAVSLVGGRLDGLVAGDEGHVGFAIEGGAAASKLPGSRAVNGVSVTLTGNRASNYTLENPSPSITVVIGRKQIWAEDITVAAPSKVYDGTDAATLHASLNPGVIVAGDGLSVALTGRYADAGVGAGKQVTVDGWSLEGASAASYGLEGPLPTGITGVISPAADVTDGGGGGGGGFSAPAEDEKPAEAEDTEAEADAVPPDLGRAWVNPFVDVEGNAWYYGDVEYAVAHGLFTGTDAASFSPNEAMTRGMLVTVLGRLCGADVRGYAAGGFDDVAADMYYAPYIAWAAENGLVLGTGDGAFAPDAELTRQDLALILMRCAAFRGDVLPKARAFVPFADEADISDYAKEATRILFEAGLISGRPGNVFDPKGRATRAEVAAVLHRYPESAAPGD